MLPPLTRQLEAARLWVRAVEGILAFDKKGSLPVRSTRNRHYAKELITTARSRGGTTNVRNGGKTLEV
jgi:hypothetical protein